MRIDSNHESAAKAEIYLDGKPFHKQHLVLIADDGKNETGLRVSDGCIVCAIPNAKGHVQLVGDGQVICETIYGDVAIKIEGVTC